MRTPNIGNALSASFWFLPAVMVTAAAAAAVGMVTLDESLGTRVMGGWPLMRSAEPETARGLLSAIATAVASMAATTFSITIVALALAAQQYTPKMLHNYMSGRGNQVALGVLAGTFVYSLLVLRSVRTDPDFVPMLALTAGLALALGSMGVFIYFIHHIASTIQGTSITADIERRTLATIGRAFREWAGEAAEEVPTGGVAVPAEGASGYVQVVEIEELVGLMAEHDLLLLVKRGVGAFVPRGGVLATLSPQERVSEEAVREVRNRFKIGEQRTHQQDVEYGVYQLVDVAIRSLSPSFNAITTASTCIDHIGSILRQLAPMDLPPWRRYQRDGETRVILPSPTFGDVLTLGFDQIRTLGESHQVILIQLLEVILDLEEVTEDPGRRRLLLQHANHIGAAADRGIRAEVNRKAIDERLREVGDRLRDVGIVEAIPPLAG